MARKPFVFNYFLPELAWEMMQTIKGLPRNPLRVFLLCGDQWNRGGERLFVRSLRASEERKVVTDIIQIMQQHSAECCSHSRCGDMTTLWTVGSRGNKNPIFFRHFYKINLLFRCIWMKLVTHCLYFAKLSRSCCWKVEHNSDEPSLT